MCRRRGRAAGGRLQTVTAGRVGSGHVAFRQAVEGREVTGSDRQAQSRKSGTQKRFEGGQKTRENQQYQLELLEALPPAKTPEAAKWRADRIAEELTREEGKQLSQAKAEVLRSAGTLRFYAIEGQT